MTSSACHRDKRCHPVTPSGVTSCIDVTRVGYFSEFILITRSELNLLRTRTSNHAQTNSGSVRTCKSHYSNNIFVNTSLACRKRISLYNNSEESCDHCKHAVGSNKGASTINIHHCTCVATIVFVVRGSCDLQIQAEHNICGGGWRYSSP